MLFRYVLSLYFRYFLLVFVALELFYVGIDFLQNLKTIPDSTNLAILYIAYMSVVALKVTLPLSIIFGVIATMMHLIRSNELVAFYSLGYTKKEILKPFFFLSFLLATFHIALNTTQAAYFAERAMSIRDNHYMSSSTANLFFRLDNELVYMGTLLPFEKKAQDIRIFRFSQEKLVEAIYAQEGLFHENAWQLKGCKHLQIVSNEKAKEHLKVTFSKEVTHLQGFRPKILDNIFEGRGNFSIVDATSALWLLNDVSINLDKVRAALYIHIFTPLFAPLFLVFIVTSFPISGRFSNTVTFSALAILGSLMAWGVMWIFQTLALSGGAQAEMVIIAPIVLLATLSFYRFFKAS